MKDKKLIYIVSEIDKSLHFEWITPELGRYFQLSFILIGQSGSALEKYLMEQNVSVYSIRYLRKIDLPRVWFSVFRILTLHRPDIVHTHLWIANLTGLTSAWLAGIRKRIYTRHHATIHYKEHPRGLKWDRLNNRLATHIVAISANVENILIKYDKAERKKIRLLHHGFSFPYFENVAHDRIDSLYGKYGIHRDKHPVVGVISRFTEWKGIKYIIMAFAKLRRVYPDAHLILANAHGNYERTIDLFLSKIPVMSYTKIPFEHDVAALYRLFDIFVHVPVDDESEAFGQTYVEPLIAGVPCIFTLSGVASEFIVNKQNAVVVDFKNADQIYAGMLDILNDESLRRVVQTNGKSSVARFTIERYLASLKLVYLEE